MTIRMKNRPNIGVPSSEHLPLDCLFFPVSR